MGLVWGCLTDLILSHFTDWRNDGERRHQETLATVRATAREQVPFNIQAVSVGEL